MNWVPRSAVRYRQHFAWLARGTLPRVSRVPQFRISYLMTTTEDEILDSIGRGKDSTTSRGGYEWTCPYCDQSRLNPADDQAGEKNAIAALRAHIHSSDGDGHGPRSSFPPERLTLSQHVVRVAHRR